MLNWVPRKLFYSGTGAAAASAACYPREAKELSMEALEEGKYLGKVVVNFVTGAQPDTAAAEANLMNRGFAFARMWRLWRRMLDNAEKKSTAKEVFTSSNQSNPSYTIVRDDDDK